MKALVCLGCSTITSPPAQGGAWIECACGQAAMRWTDPAAGLAEVRATDRSITRVLGLNNQFLGLPDSVHAELAASDHAWRDQHRQSCRDVAPNYLFHADRRDCWAIITRPGDSADVTFREETP